MLWRKDPLSSLCNASIPILLLRTEFLLGSGKKVGEVTLGSNFTSAGSDSKRWDSLNFLAWEECQGEHSFNPNNRNTGRK